MLYRGVLGVVEELLADVVGIGSVVGGFPDGVVELVGGVEGLNSQWRNCFSVWGEFPSAAGE
ncbi:hypothetical protein AB685_16035 [Bacillus sp. LL01]|nr:hypothetical protein AB685_16035 [Bacillus sp. LL01]